MSLEIMHKDDLPLGGFAGLTEKRLVVDEVTGTPDRVTEPERGHLAYVGNLAWFEL